MPCPAGFYRPAMGPHPHAMGPHPHHPMGPHPDHPMGPMPMGPKPDHMHHGMLLKLSENSVCFASCVKLLSHPALLHVPIFELCTTQHSTPQHSFCSCLHLTWAMCKPLSACPATQVTAGLDPQAWPQCPTCPLAASP